MKFIVSVYQHCIGMIEWLGRHRRYRLIAVSAITGGWMYVDSVAHQICWVQSQLVNAGTPLEISEGDAQTMLNPESVLGWERIDPGDRVWYSDINQLIAAAKSELAKRGADATEVA